MSKINIVGTILDKIELSTICPFCSKSHTIIINRNEFINGMKEYRNGTSIQDAFPNFTPSQREFLLTGICDKCWDNMM